MPKFNAGICIAPLQLLKAIADGYDVRGIFYWTLMDNIEWHEGFRVKVCKQGWGCAFAWSHFFSWHVLILNIKWHEGFRVKVCKQGWGCVFAWCHFFSWYVLILNIEWHEGFRVEVPKQGWECAFAWCQFLSWHVLILIFWTLNGTKASGLRCVSKDEGVLLHDVIFFMTRSYSEHWMAQRLQG